MLLSRHWPNAGLPRFVTSAGWSGPRLAAHDAQPSRARAAVHELSELRSGSAHASTEPEISEPGAGNVGGEGARGVEGAKEAAEDENEEEAPTQAAVQLS